MKDNHLIALADVFNIKLPSEVHLLALVEEFLEFKAKSEDPDMRYKFRLKNNGEYYWINTSNLETTKIYPYKSELENILEVYRQVVNKEKESLKLKNQVLDTIMQYFETKDELKVFGAMRIEAKRFVKKFVFNYKNAKNVRTLKNIFQLKNIILVI